MPDKLQELGLEEKLLLANILGWNFDKDTETCFVNGDGFLNEYFPWDNDSDALIAIRTYCRKKGFLWNIEGIYFCSGRYVESVLILSNTYEMHSYWHETLPLAVCHSILATEQLEKQRQGT